MAIHLYVYLERLRIPAFSRWSEAIAREGFPLAFPAPVNPAKHNGYLPALLQGEESGFELSVSEIADKEENVPDDILSRLPRVDAVADFRFHEMHEYLAATIAAAVLARLSDGAFSDPQEDGRVFFGEAALAEARLELQKADQDAAHDPAKLSPARWARVFEEQLREVHPDYRLNPNYRGRAVECTRENCGIFLSQNCVSMHDTYRHCFGIVLTRTKLGHALYNPFTIGSRFNHNSTIPSAYMEEYRASRGQPAPRAEIYCEYGCTERRARQGVAATAKFAEEFFTPIYMKRLSRGGERLAALFCDSIRFIEQWGVSEESLRLPASDDWLIQAFARELYINDPPEEWYDYVVVHFNAIRLADANGFSGDRLLSFRRDANNMRCDDVLVASDRFRSIPDEIRSAAIFVSYAEDFLRLRSELPGIVNTIEKLKDSLI